MSRRGKLQVGTSGWNYSHWRGRFYPQGLPVSRWFEHYCGEFDTVEINNTFYRLPGLKTFDGWKQQAPRTFRYAVKANRFITHMKKLKDPGDSVRRFLGRTRRLGAHLGPILYQLPPQWSPNLDRLEDFCARLPRALTHVIEFRDRSWLDGEVFQILEDHHVCLCIHDLLKRHPRRVTGGAVYVRFHGVGRKYGGSYSKQRLRDWAKWMKDAASDGHDVYAYFNNDQNAAAVRNARTLRDILADG